MGDYGFKGAGEFGGTSVGENFNCLPDRHYTKCPNSETGLLGEGPRDTRRVCKLIGKPDADGRGFRYGFCIFSGDDYEECPVLKGVKSIESTCDVIEEVKEFLGARAEASRQEAQEEEKRRLFNYILEGYRGG